jgi:hypothetical protein
MFMFFRGKWLIDGAFLPQIKFCSNVILGAHLMYIWAGSGKIAGTTQNMHMRDQGRILILCCKNCSERKTFFFFLINHAQIKESISCPCNLGLISAY